MEIDVKAEEEQRRDGVKSHDRYLGVDDWQARVNDPTVKAQLRANTDEAVANGVFGVPTFVVDGEIFWGDDVTDMMLDFLADPEPFRSGEWERLGDLPVAAQRKESRL